MNGRIQVQVSDVTFRFGEIDVHAISRDHGLPLGYFDIAQKPGFATIQIGDDLIGLNMDFLIGLKKNRL